MTVDYEKLNPGIRRTVKWLNDHGFLTSDSGDGKTHEFECDRDHAYVVILVPTPEELVAQTQRLVALLEGQGVVLGPVGFNDAPCIQASYDPVNGLPVIDLMNLDDDKLFHK